MPKLASMASPSVGSQTASRSPAAPAAMAAPPTLPMTDEEDLLARRLKSHLARHPRRCEQRPTLARPRETTTVRTGAPASGPEEVVAFEDPASELPLSALLPPPLPGGSATADPDSGTDSVDETMSGAVPVWLTSRPRPTLRERVRVALAWTTTLMIVLAVIGGAMIGLIGTQRSLVLAHGAAELAKSAGRVLGFVHS